MGLTIVSGDVAFRAIGPLSRHLPISITIDAGYKRATIAGPSSQSRLMAAARQRRR